MLTAHCLECPVYVPFAHCGTVGILFVTKFPGPLLLTHELCGVKSNNTYLNKLFSALDATEELDSWPTSLDKEK